MIDIQKNINKNPIQLEQKILKAIFKRNNAIMDVVDILSSEMFTTALNASVYTAMVELFKEETNINSETVCMYLQNNNIDFEINEIKQLYNESYTSLKIKDTALIVKELYLRRKMLTSMRELLEQQEQCPTTSDIILESINNIAVKSNESVSGKEETDNRCCNDVDKILEDIDNKLMDLGEEKGGIKTGIPVIDNDLEGLLKKRLWTVVADSQVGKSAFAIQLAVQALMLNKDINVSYYSLEMEKQEVEERALANITNIEPRYISNPIKYFSKFNPSKGEIELDITEEKLIQFKQAIKDGADTLKGYNFYIDDSADLDIVTLEAKIKKNHLKNGKTDIIIIDHAGILCDGSPSEVVGKMDVAYKKFKQWAKKLDCVVIALHQFSNDLKNDPVRFPNIFSLRGSAAPRHYSDIIMGIYRPSVYPDVIKNYPELENTCQFVWQKVRYTAKPCTTNLDYNGFRFIEKTPDELQGEIVGGKVFLDVDGNVIGDYEE